MHPSCFLPGPPAFSQFTAPTRYPSCILDPGPVQTAFGTLGKLGGEGGEGGGKGKVGVKVGWWGVGGGVG